MNVEILRYSKTDLLRPLSPYFCTFVGLWILNDDKNLIMMTCSYFSAKRAREKEKLN